MTVIMISALYITRISEKKMNTYAIIIVLDYDWLLL